MSLYGLRYLGFRGTSTFRRSLPTAFQAAAMQTPATPESSKGSPKVIFPSRQPCLEGKMTFGKPQISEVVKGFTPSSALAWRAHHSQ